MDPRPASALQEPLSRWTVGGVLLLGVAVVLLAVQAASLPSVLGDATDGVQAVRPALPLLGTLVLAAAGAACVRRGRSRRRAERFHAARRERMSRARRDPASSGVSPGVAGTLSRPPVD